MKQISCKICINKTNAVYDEQFNQTYYYCPACKYIFLDEKHIVDSQKEKSVYNQHNNTMENEGYVNMFKRFIKRAVEPYEASLTTALDFGCGPGPVLAALLRERGYEVDIYDPYFAPDQDFQCKKYDLITSTEVFEHLTNPLETLKMLQNHINKGGVLAVITLFHPDDTNLFKQWWYRKDPTHISFFQPKTFEVLTEIVGGLRIIDYDEKNTVVLQKS